MRRSSVSQLHSGRLFLLVGEDRLSDKRGVRFRYRRTMQQAVSQGEADAAKKVAHFYEIVESFRRTIPTETDDVPVTAFLDAMTKFLRIFDALASPIYGDIVKKDVLGNIKVPSTSVRGMNSEVDAFTPVLQPYFAQMISCTPITVWQMMTCFFTDC